MHNLNNLWKRSPCSYWAAHGLISGAALISKVHRGRSEPSLKDEFDESCVLEKGHYHYYSPKTVAMLDAFPRILTTGIAGETGIWSTSTDASLDVADVVERVADVDNHGARIANADVRDS